jgi:hypothetical protein
MVQNAMLALNETVRVAQQLNDDTILQHALSQLCHLLASTLPSAAAEGGQQPVDAPAYFAQLFQLLQRSDPPVLSIFRDIGSCTRGKFRDLLPVRISVGTGGAGVSLCKEARPQSS